MKDEEDEEDLPLWMEHLEGKDKDEQTYFTFINETRTVMKAGTQAWNCYGNRTNNFLLVNYGFCFQNNLYDSYTFEVRLDLIFKPHKIISIKEMLAPSNDVRAVQEIRLKRY